MQHDLDVTLDELVKALRETANLTQEQLAARVGVSKGYIGRIEAGNSSVGVENLRRIADALGASTRDRRRLATARDKASDRFSTKRGREPTDIGPRPSTSQLVATSVLADARTGSPRKAPAGSPSPPSPSADPGEMALAQVAELAVEVRENLLRLIAIEARVSELERSPSQRRGG